MKKFEEPKVEVVMFATEDIITTSEEDPGFMTVPCIS